MLVRRILSDINYEGGKYSVIFSDINLKQSVNADSMHAVRYLK